MPMGLRNSPSVHQRRVANALREHIGKICHIYLDDIVVWSNSIEEHVKHTRKIMQCLREHGLCLNPNKTNCFALRSISLATIYPHTESRLRQTKLTEYSIGQCQKVPPT